MLTFAKGQVVKMNPKQVQPLMTVKSIKTTIDYEIWHKCFGHPSKNIFLKLKENVNGFDKVEVPKEQQRCIGCLKGKMKAKPYKESIKRATKVFHLIHMDLMECPIQSYHKYKYICVIVDDFSSYTWIGLLSHKNDTLKYFQTWYSRFHDLNNRVFYLHSNHGGEFVNKAFEQFLSEKGIIHQKSTPHVHQQNGRAERMNLTLTDKAKAMRLDAHCPKSWWEFAFETSVHIYNHTPLRCTLWKTPLENLTGKKPDVAYLRVFGCEAWVFIPQEKHTDKLSPKSEHMTFIGYEQNSKAYRFMTSNNSIVISSQATFFETRFPQKGLDLEQTTKDLGPIWENSDSPENLVNQPNTPDIDLDTRGYNHSHRRSASPDPSQQSGPSNNEDDIKRDDDSDKDSWKSDETFDDYLKKKKEQLEKNRQE